jgi:hypothetical protein
LERPLTAKNNLGRILLATDSKAGGGQPLGWTCLAGPRAAAPGGEESVGNIQSGRGRFFAQKLIFLTPFVVVFGRIVGKTFSQKADETQANWCW